ncbi:MAG TPA: hypothetical protein VMS31_12645, partial [Pyrinomonadaceae bacterium]|nr:hypothetical protein [Pyrinomonadaceae bacterium]
ARSVIYSSPLSMIANSSRVSVAMNGIARGASRPAPGYAMERENLVALHGFSCFRRGKDATQITSD